MTPQEGVDVEWGWTPDVLLFIAAAILSLALIVAGLWLFRTAWREESSHDGRKQ